MNLIRHAVERAVDVRAVDVLTIALLVVFVIVALGLEKAFGGAE